MSPRLAGLLLLICLLATRATAQPYTLKGSVADTLNKANLERASVSLIRAKDSVLTTFTRTDAAGAFQLRVDSLGRYILLVSYPGFANYIDGVTLKGNEQLAPIGLVSRTHVLQEFVLKKKAAAIVIKGDTTEYAADSFAVRSGASVEELLKKLPGLQVDKDGKVTAQGEQVQKILVDGEEFFSDDPAVVTKNLQAATVDKVQVYDKKSDEASFTGIDDGEKTKTINLTLKEDKKKGLFGKAVAGGGPSLSPDQRNTGFFENEAMVNLFKGKQQIAAFGIMSNSGTTGLGWGDREKFGGGSGISREYDEETGNMYTYSSGDEDMGGWSGKYSGEGLPTVWTGGLHYANKWGKDVQHLSANYRFSKNNISTEGTSTTQYITPGSEYVRRQTRSSFSTSKRHGGDGLYEWTIDTSSNIKLMVNGNYSERGTSGVYHTETIGADGGLINTNHRGSSNNSTSEAINASLIYRKKFAKKGRNMSAEMRMNTNSSDGTGYLQSENRYFSIDTVTGKQDTAVDPIDQRKTNGGESFSINAKLSYTEPLSKVAFLTVRYGANVNNSKSERFSYNRNGVEWSDVLDTAFSSSFGYDVFTQNLASSLRFVFKKYNFALGAEVFNTSWKQNDRLYQLRNRTRDYTNFAPTASVKYNFTKQANLSFNYSGRTSQPTIEQLQPLQQNTDPLNVSIGNPELKQEFSNSFNFNYHSYKPLSGVYAYAGGGGTITQNDISRSETFDDSGRHYYEYINVNGNYNFYFWGGYGFKLKKPGVDLRLNSYLNTSHNNTYINGQKNTSDNNTYTLSLDISKNWKKADKDIASISVGPGISYYDNKATISAYANSYWTSEISADAFVELPLKLQFRTEAWYYLRQQTDVFTVNNNSIRWNASLGRKFLKGDKLELKAQVSDILNQNIGYNRNSQANFITEDRYNTIRRHALFSLIYLFSSGAGTVKNDDDD
jgi:hypothetical protein